MDKYINKEAVELKLKEIKAKYIDCLDFLTGYENFLKTLEIEAGNVETFTKLMDSQKNKKSQVEKIFGDLPSKYEYFADIIGQKVSKKVIEGIRVELLDKTVLENKIVEMELKYIEALGFNFSYATIVSYNDEINDKDNLKNLEESKRKNDIAFEDIKAKIDLFKSLLKAI